MQQSDNTVTVAFTVKDYVEILCDPLCHVTQ